MKLIPKNKKYNFNDFINKIIKNKYKIGIYPIEDNLWYDVGNWTNFNKANR